MNLNLFEINKLYVIGNGFDLHHGISSYYENFKIFLQNECSDVYTLLTKLYGNLDTKWWRSFEESLAFIDTVKYPKTVAEEPFFNQLKDLRQKFGINSYSIIDYYENENRKGITSEYDRASLIAHIEMTILKKGLKEAFGEWVKSLSKPNVSLKVKGLNTDALFFTFNYTMTLEDLYKIDAAQVVHLHGSVNTGVFEFGHNMTSSSMLKKDLAEHGYERDPFIVNAEDGVRMAMFDVAEELKKPVNEIIVEHNNAFNSLDGLEEMEILGFSYSPIDLPYLQRILEVTGKDINVILGWHSNEDMINAKEFAKKNKLTQNRLKKF